MAAEHGAVEHGVVGPAAFPGRRASTAYDLADHLRLRILSGELAVGSRLPPQDRFAAQLGVARSVLREALASLERTGYVATRRGKHGGSFVLGTTADPDEWLARSAGRLGEIREAFEYRAAVEGHAASLAAARRTDDDLAVLTDAVTLDPDRPLAPHEFRLADARFHAAVAAAAGNRYLADAVRHARAELFLRTDRLVFVQEVGQMLAEHRAVLAAVADRDPAAARARMVEHLEESLRAWESLLRPS